MMLKDRAAIITGVVDKQCADYGLDTISCGAVIGFAMECFEKGLIARTIAYIEQKDIPYDCKKINR